MTLSFTRLHVIGSVQRADVMVSDEQAMGALLPQLAGLVQEPNTERGLVLVTPLGAHVDLSSKVTDLELVDGTELLLVPETEAPTAPDVVDVADTVAESTDRSPSRWSSRSTRLLSTIAGATASWIVCISVAPADGSALAAALILAAFGLTGCILSATSRRLRSVGPGSLGVTIGTISTLSTAASDFAPRFPGLPAASSSWITLVVVTWAVVSCCYSVLRRSPAPLLGMVSAYAVLVVVIVPELLGLSTAAALAIGAVSIVAALGIFPSLALSRSGLTALDDQVVTGGSAPRKQVLDRLSRAGTDLSWGIAGIAAALPFALTALVSTSGAVWPRYVALCLAIVVVLRVRVLPTAGQRWLLIVATLLTAALVVIRTDPHSTARWMALGIALVVIGAVLILPSVKVRPHVRIRLRRTGDLLETLAAVALMPVALGCFGVYSEALKVFS